MSSEIEEIKSRLNLVDVVSDYVALKKAGANFRAKCPFHQEKTPSFYVSPARQVWHCFGCSLGGDMFEFVKQIEGSDFPQALEKLAEKAGVELPAFRAASAAAEKKKILYNINALAAKYYHKVLKESRAAKEAREYLTARKFRSETIKFWQLGYAPEAGDLFFQFLRKKGFSEADIQASGLALRGERGDWFDRFRDRIMFPIFDFSGRIAGFAGRILHPREGVGKYVNSPESPVYSKSRIIFGLFQARDEIRKKNEAVVVEGNADVVKSFQAGIRHVIASSGTALTENQLTLVSRLCNVLVFAFDADAAGSEAARRALNLALGLGFNVKLASLPSGFKDPDELIDHSHKLWEKVLEEASGYLDFYFHKLFDILDLSDPQAKRDAAVQFLSLLTLVPDPIIRAHYASLVAQTIGVKEQVIADLLNERQKTSGPSVAPSPQPLVKKSAHELLEKKFLRLLLIHPQAVPFVLLHEPEHFLDPENRQLFLQIRQAKADGQIAVQQVAVDHQGLKTELELAQFTAEIQDSKSFEEEEKQELPELSRRLQLAYLVRERARVTEEIKEAEKNKRAEQKKQLVVQFNELSQKIFSIEQGPRSYDQKKETAKV